MLKLLQSFFSLDIAWINYFWGQRPFHVFKMLLRKDRKNGSTTFQLIKYVAKILRSFRNRFYSKPEPGNPEILIFIDSLNNLRALAPIKENLSNGSFWVDGSMAKGLFFPSDIARLVGLMSLPLVVFHYFQKKKLPHKWTLKFGLCGYLDAYGYFLIGSIFLKKIRPKLLVVGNDHEPQTRALLKAAKNLGIETAYIQHAPVTKYFPPLEVDYALLDGEVSVERYKKMNERCRIFLVGMSRRPSTPHFQKQSQDTINVGLVFNDLDAWHEVENLVSDVSTNPRFNISIRPHPADWLRRKSFIEIATRKGLKFSDPKIESPWQFLSGLNFVIGGNSGILLEAAFAGVIPIQYERLTKGYDHYGYQKAGISLSIRTLNEIESLLPETHSIYPQIKKGLQKFDSTFDTPEDGKASEVASSVLEKLLKTRFDSQANVPFEKKVRPYFVTNHN